VIASSLGVPAKTLAQLIPDEHMTIVDNWPLRSFLELGALAGAIPSARLHTRLVTREWRLAALGETAELLVSELMTNAVAASQSLDEVLPVRLWLLSDGARVLILVWDTDPRQPVPVDAGADAESGRGLLLVETLSQQWGSYVPARMGGKTVWALLGELR
jgi:hypothetical protein